MPHPAREPDRHPPGGAGRPCPGPGGWTRAAVRVEERHVLVTRGRRQAAADAPEETPANPAAQGEEATK